MPEQNRIFLGDLKEPQNKFTLLSFIGRKIGALYNNQKLTIED